MSDPARMISRGHLAAWSAGDVYAFQPSRWVRIAQRTRAILAAVPVGTGNPTQPLADD